MAPPTQADLLKLATAIEALNERSPTNCAKVWLPRVYQALSEQDLRRLWVLYGDGLQVWAIMVDMLKNMD